MKRELRCIALIILVCILSLQAFAHAGDLQNKGTPEQGHYDRSTGEYHYHHSNIHEGACQYPADECPLNTENKTASVSESEKSRQNASDSNKQKSYITSDAPSGIAGIIWRAFAFSFIYLFPTAALIYLIASVIKERRESQKKAALKCEQGASISGTVKPASKHLQKEKAVAFIQETEKASCAQKQTPKSKRIKMVYYTTHGKSFHRIKSCPKLAKSKNIQKAPFDEMKWKLPPCETCYKKHWKNM